MSAPDPFIAKLAAAVAAEPLREKVLLAPSHRVGRQWLDRAAAAAGAIANVRSTGIGRLLLDFAEDGLRRQGLRPARREEKVRLVGIALADLAADSSDEGYFTRLPGSARLAEKLLDTLEELEAALVRNAMGLAAGIANPAKADELAKLARRYETARRRAGLAGLADIHQAALAALAKTPEPPLLMVPASLYDGMSALEWGFVSRWPAESRLRVEEDEAGVPAAPDFATADSVANEARAVFRRVQTLGIPLDQTEVVCLDTASYAPALCAAGLEMFGGRPEDLPVTFMGGLPGYYARPVRLLAAWLAWLEQDLPPEGLARLLDAGLLDDAWRKAAPGVAATALAARLRALAIDGGPAEYRRRLRRPDGDDAMARAEAWLAKWLTRTLPLADAGDALDLSRAGAVLGAAEALLAGGGAGDGKLDAYARRALLDAIRAWAPHADWPGFDAMAWLNELAANLRVMGLGPMPGKMHVSDLMGGGHSGRRHTFIVGMDDSRFPGSTRQDPVLLDNERAVISGGLPRSGRRRLLREKALTRLLARLDGSVTLSHARRDAGGRRLYPAAVFTRLADAAGTAEAETVLRPAADAARLNRRDDWLAVLLAGRGNTLTPDNLAPWHPHLAAGAAAVRARASSRFGAYDGFVPEAGDDWRRNGPPLSPTDLETLASCPLEFFFKRVLGIIPPERYQPRPGRWLPGNVRGSLLHDLFQDFLQTLESDGAALSPDTLGDASALLLRLLDDALRRERRRTPVRDPLAGLREERELREACGIFLDSELLRQDAGRPLCFEAALGGARQDAPPWNRAAPVEIRLDSGRTLLLRGRVDRIDRLHGHGGLMILDYKTGLSSAFSPDDPFRQGRHLQPLLYTMMLENVLAAAGRPEPVRGFAYFFPMPRDEGRTIFYPRDTLDTGGRAVLEHLADLLAGGSFPFTTDPGDVAYSDYAPIYGNPKALAAATRAKSEADPALAAWAALRGVL